MIGACSVGLFTVVVLWRAIFFDNTPIFTEISAESITSTIALPRPVEEETEPDQLVSTSLEDIITVEIIPQGTQTHETQVEGWRAANNGEEEITAMQVGADNDEDYSLEYDVNTEGWRSASNHEEEITAMQSSANNTEDYDLDYNTSVEEPYAASNAGGYLVDEDTKAKGWHAAKTAKDEVAARQENSDFEN